MVINFEIFTDVALKVINFTGMIMNVLLSYSTNIRTIQTKSHPKLQYLPFVKGFWFCLACFESYFVKCD